MWSSPICVPKPLCGGAPASRRCPHGRDLSARAVAVCNYFIFMVDAFTGRLVSPFRRLVCMCRSVYSCRFRRVFVLVAMDRRRRAMARRLADTMKRRRDNACYFVVLSARCDHQRRYQNMLIYCCLMSARCEPVKIGGFCVLAPFARRSWRTAGRRAKSFRGT